MLASIRCVVISMVLPVVLCGCFVRENIPVVERDAGIPDVGPSVDDAWMPDVGPSVDGVDPTALGGTTIETVTGTVIRALAADATHLYWVEEGTTDPLGNYLDDGRLRSWPIAGGNATTLASGLSGPARLAVTAAFVYVSLDKSVGLDGLRHRGLVRVPIAGGEVQPIVAAEADSFLWSLTSDGNRAFFIASGSVPANGLAITADIFAVADDELAPVAIVSDFVSHRPVVSAYGGFAYYGNASPHDADASSIVHRIPEGGGTSEDLISLPSASAIVAQGDRLYSLEVSYQSCGSSIYLTRNRVGSSSLRIADIGSACGAEFARFGEHIAITRQEASVGVAVFGGSLESEAGLRAYGVIRLGQPWVEAPVAPSEVGLFWTDGSTIKLRPW